MNYKLHLNLEAVWPSFQIDLKNLIPIYRACMLDGSAPCRKRAAEQGADWKPAPHELTDEEVTEAMLRNDDLGDWGDFLTWDRIKDIFSMEDEWPTPETMFQSSLEKGFLEPEIYEKKES